MSSPKNRAVIASAGSGKTTSIVNESLSRPDQRILVLTYTLENVEELRRGFVEAVGGIPPHVTINSWFSFLLRDGVRPYQNHLVAGARVRTIIYEDRSAVYRKRSEYLTASHDIYRDKVSQFVVDCNGVSGGLIIRRLAGIYDQVFVDEIQDCAGYDLDFLRALFGSAIRVTVVGDPRQATFSTNRSKRNRQYRRSDVYEWLKERAAAGEVVLDEQAHSYRCNQDICDFADALYPGFPKTTSLNATRTSHDGIHYLKVGDLPSYIEAHNPVILRYSKAANTGGLRAINMGASKGRTFDRVVIFPTGPMLKYFRTGRLADAGDLAKFYVGVTRARFSVAFVLDA